MMRTRRCERRAPSRVALLLAGALIGPILQAAVFRLDAQAAPGDGAVPAAAGAPSTAAARPAKKPTVAPLDDLDALKTFWQGRYRSLRQDEARLVETLRLATKEYADSNRRNYRRSGVRHFHRTNANEAKVELAKVREQIAACHDEVVAAGGMGAWLDEVDDEPIDPNAVQGLGVYRDDGRFGGKGAYAEDEETKRRREEEAVPGDGRNPIYDSNEADEADDSDEPAAISDEQGNGGFNYDAWRKNRGEYEENRAPEKHLKPGED
jgi:hypothetical protein